MGRRKEYIESPYWFKDMYQKYVGSYTVVEKFPIENIKFDKRLLAYANEVDTNEVLRMLMNFDQSIWEPIHVNEDYYLLDGQHRLQVAKHLCLKYVDVIIRRDET